MGPEVSEAIVESAALTPPAAGALRGAERFDALRPSSASNIGGACGRGASHGLESKSLGTEEIVDIDTTVWLGGGGIGTSSSLGIAGTVGAAAAEGADGRHKQSKSISQGCSGPSIQSESTRPDNPSNPTAWLKRPIPSDRLQCSTNVLRFDPVGTGGSLPMEVPVSTMLEVGYRSQEKLCIIKARHSGPRNRSSCRATSSRGLPAKRRPPNQSAKKRKKLFMPRTARRFTRQQQVLLETAGVPPSSPMDCRTQIALLDIGYGPWLERRPGPRTPPAA